MLHFPSSPNVDDVYEGPNIKWRWDGKRWVRLGGGAGGAGVITSPTPPSNPAPNTLWFNSSNGALFLWFDVQWVEITSEGGGGGGITLSEVQSEISDALASFTVPSPTTGTANWVRQTTPTINQPRIVGVTNGSNAASGEVGEFIHLSAFDFNVPPSLPLGTLPAGDWMVYGEVFLGPSGMANPTAPISFDAVFNCGNKIATMLSTFNMTGFAGFQLPMSTVRVSTTSSLALRCEMGIIDPAYSIGNFGAEANCWRVR